MRTNPTDLFNALNDEVANSGGSDSKGEQMKTAESKITTELVLDKSFFAKVASNDEVAISQLSNLIDEGVSQGLTTEQITSYINDAEVEANKVVDKTASPGAGADSGLSEEEQALVDEVISSAIDDALEGNELAKIAGLDRAGFEEALNGMGMGEIYIDARVEADDTITKIAEQMIVDDNAIELAIKIAKDQGLDVASLEAELAAMKAPAEKTAAEKVAEKRAADEEILTDSLSVLKLAGFDIEKTAEDAEAKKKMSLGKKVGLGAAGVAGLAGGVAGFRNRGAIASGAKNLAEKGRYQAALFRMSRKK